MTQAVEHSVVAGARGVVAAVGNESNEYLTFALGEEAYAIEILKVQEIRGYEAVTTIPNSPAYLKGVINLRGTIVPILDLRIKLNFDKVEYGRFTVVIILNLAERVIGAVVDSVSDVITLGRDQVKPAPQFSGNFSTDYIMGLASVEERTVILLDIEKLTGASEASAPGEAAQ